MPALTPRILFVITTLDVGGAEMHLLWLVQGLRARGYDVDVAYLKGQGTLVPRFEQEGARTFAVPFDGARALLRAVRALSRRIRAGRYDLVHTHLLKADVVGALACRVAGQRAVVATKHNEEQVLKRRLVGWIHGAVSRIPRRVIALSDHVLEFVATAGRVGRSRLVRIYYGIDPDRFRAAPGARERLRAELGLRAGTSAGVCVARFHPQKDHPTAFRAAARLAEQGRDVVLLLVGGDPFFDHQPRLEALAAQLRLGDRVRFLGIRHDVADLLAASDLFVLPSLFEGLGLVFLEAMAAARPVISTNTSAIPEVVADGETGLLVPVGDDAALASAWAHMQDEPTTAMRMGAAGRARVERLFTLPRMIDETVRVYEQVLAETRGRCADAAQSKR